MAEPTVESYWKDLQVKDQKMIVCRAEASSCPIKPVKVSSEFEKALLRQWKELLRHRAAGGQDVGGGALPFPEVEAAAAGASYPPAEPKGADVAHAAAIATLMDQGTVLYELSADEGLIEKKPIYGGPEGLTRTGFEILHKKVLTLADVVALGRKENRATRRQVLDIYGYLKGHVTRYHDDISLRHPGTPEPFAAMQDRLGNCYFHAVLNGYLYHASKAEREAIIRWRRRMTSDFEVVIGKRTAKIKEPTLVEAALLSKGGSVGRDGEIVYREGWPAVLEKAYASILVDHFVQDNKIYNFRLGAGSGLDVRKNTFRILAFTYSNVGTSLAIDVFKGNSSTIYVLAGGSDLGYQAIRSGTPYEVVFTNRTEDETKKLAAEIKAAVGAGRVVVLASGAERFRGVSGQEHERHHAYAVYRCEAKGSDLVLHFYNPHGYKDAITWSAAAQVMGMVVVESTMKTAMGKKVAP